MSQQRAASLVSKHLGRPVTQQNISQWETGIMPGADVAEAIRTLTGGRVTGDSFRRLTHQPNIERNQP